MNCGLNRRSGCFSPALISFGDKTTTAAFNRASTVQFHATTAWLSGQFARTTLNTLR